MTYKYKWAPPDCGVSNSPVDNAESDEFFVDARFNAGTLCPMWLVSGTPDMSAL
jgi:hypothetical protein